MTDSVTLEQICEAIQSVKEELLESVKAKALLKGQYYFAEEILDMVYERIKEADKIV